MWAGCVQFKSLIELTQPYRGHADLYLNAETSPPPIAALPLFFAVLSVSHQPLVVLSEEGEQSRK